MLGGADNLNGELPSYITGANNRSGNGVRQHLNGEPDALKGARPVRGGEAGK
ncbi:hypothetical protein [Escherichia coli]|uniref:hypothetical protein n=1 Tax=Escherichia coli TaxID=562 RepID=UPI003F659EF7